MSPSIPPNSSSEPAADGAPGAAVSLGALTARLAEEFNAGPDVLGRVAAAFREVRERAPDLFVPVAGTLAAAFETQAVSGSTDAATVHAALGEWALDAEGEPLERMRRDCQRFQDAMTRGVLRLYGGDAAQCTETLLALQRFNFLQLALLASLAARSQEEGGVVRTLPTPEYAAFMEIFRNAIESHRQDGRQLGLLLLQVGKVEQIDRQLGLQKGEAFMLRVTRRMREGVLRRQDQLGRVSRDQFACLLPGIAGEGVAILAANKVLGALEVPIPIGDRIFDTDVVIGIAVYPDHGSDAQTLVRNAKLAARVARGSAERSAVYDPAHGESEERQLRYETRLRHALEQNTLGLAFEPQLDAQSGRIGGLECSLRWTDAELGEVSEAEALSTAEGAGLVREVIWWLFNNALRQSAEFAKAGLQCKLGLKVSASGLLQPDFPEFVDRALRTWGVPPGRVVIGVHESAIAGDLAQVKDAFARLKRLGLRLGIAGFATGASSLGNLAQLPFDEMQLSAEFVHDMQRSPLHGKIIRSLVRLARDLGLRVTAEGVADGETVVALLALGCERVQGPHVSPPLTAEDIMVFEKSGAGLAKLRLSDL
ncbi:MAG: EAL domain-containing protein [Burkholderiales bacterium]|nr:EAL domain-containing protein [Burkholderiales bacterium]MCW5603977.1 EAL domain-containing protein [Burkholderiales bacterium]